MKKYAIQLPALGILLICIGVVAAIVIDSPLTQKTYAFKKPLEVIEMFYAAVDREELTAFNAVIKREQLVPDQVIYTYKLSDMAPSIQVYSLIREPFPVSTGNTCKVGAITAIINLQGEIIDSVVHVLSCE